MKYIKAIKWLFLVALFGVSMTSCALLGSLFGNAKIFLTYPEPGSTVTITNSSQVITLKGTVTSDADIDTVTVNPNGVGDQPANFSDGNWDVGLNVTPQDYKIEVTAKDVNGAESTETFSFTVVLNTNGSSVKFNHTWPQSNSLIASGSDVNVEGNGIIDFVGIPCVHVWVNGSNFAKIIIDDTNDLNFHTNVPASCLNSDPGDSNIVKLQVCDDNGGGEVRTIVVNVSPMQFDVTYPTETEAKYTTNSVDVIYEVTNAAYPVQMSYYFTNEFNGGEPGWDLPNVSNDDYGSFTIPVSHLTNYAEGTHIYVEVCASDTNGIGFTDGGFFVVLDTTPPVITLTGITNGQTNAVGTTNTITLSVSDAVAGMNQVEVMTNGLDLMNYNPGDPMGSGALSPTDLYIPIVAGSNVIVVGSWDNLGNEIYQTNVIVGTN